MTEEAEKLIGTREEERDDGKEEVVEKVDGESEMKTDTYDLVILGASGFTGDHFKVLNMIWSQLPIIGQYVVQYVFKAAKEHQITWAVAGTELKALHFIA